MVNDLWFIDFIPYIGQIIKFILSKEENSDWDDIFNCALRLGMSKEEFENLFDDKNIEAIINNLKKKTGFDLRNDLIKEFQNLFTCSGADYEQYSDLIEKIIGIIMNKIKQEKPDIYERYLVQDSNNKISTLYGLLANNQKRLNVYDINYFVNYIKGLGSGKYHLSLDYYELDDSSASEVIEEKVRNKENIFVEYYCPEEALYRLINYFKINNYENVFVVNDKESWEAIRNIKIENALLIPYFFYERLECIDNNINIILSDGTNYHSNVDEYIKLKKRTRNNIYHALTNIIGLESSEANKLIIDTNGLYVPLQIILTDNKCVYNFRYIIGKDILEDTLYLTLINEWEEKDNKCIEDYFSIKDINEVINELSKGPNPLFIKKMARHNRNHYAYKVAFYQAAYYEMQKELTNKKIDKFIGFVFNCLTDLSSNSEVLIKGVLKSLTYIYFYSDLEVKNNVEEKFDNLFSDIDTIEKYEIYYHLFNEFVNIVPNATLKKYHELYLLNPQKFSNLLQVYNYDLYWAVEKLIQNSKYTMSAIELAAKVYEYNDIAKDILKDSLCIWMNVLPKRYKHKKVEIANALIASNEKIWNILYENLPKHNGAMVRVWSESPIADDRIEREVNRKEYAETAIGYFSICVNYLNNDINRMVNLLNDVSIYSNQEFLILIDKIKSSLNVLDDLSKADLYYKIRKHIFNIKYYEDNWGKVDDEIYKTLVDLLSSFTYRSAEYDYYYLYVNYYKGILLEPIKYDQDQYRQKNDETTHLLRLEKIKEYKNRGCDLKKLIRLFKNSPDNCLGQYIALGIDNNALSLETFDLILKNDLSKDRTILKKYCFSLSSNFDNYKEMVKYVLKTDYPLLSKIEVLDSYTRYDDRLINIIETCPKNLQKIYWSKIRLYGDNYSNEMISFITKSLIKYGNKKTYVDYLSFFVKKMDNQTICMYLELLESVYGKWNEIDGYDITQILEQLNLSSLTVSQIESLCELELNIRNIIRWEDMKFTKHCFASNPIYYAKTIINSFKTKGSNLSKYLDSRFDYSLYYHAQFCPGYVENLFDSELFDDWITGYREILSECNFVDFFNDSIGRLLVFSPADNDGIIPLAHIRDFIEKEGDDSLLNSFIVAESNKRGVYTVTGGEEEKKIAKQYKIKADYLKSKGYLECARIYNALASDYNYQSDSERKMAEDE